MSYLFLICISICIIVSCFIDHAHSIFHSLAENVSQIVESILKFRLPKRIWINALALSQYTKDARALTHLDTQVIFDVVEFLSGKRFVDCNSHQSTFELQSSGGGKTESEHETPESSVRRRETGVHGSAAQNK